jgi:hypothetical protein
VIGGFNVLKMLTAASEWRVKPFYIGFFCLHYGIFTSVHGLFLVLLFGGGPQRWHRFPGPGAFWSVVRENHLGWALLGLAISHGVSFVTNYLGQGEYRRASLDQLIMQPYGRVIVLHVAILAGAFLLFALHSPTGGVGPARRAEGGPRPARPPGRTTQVPGESGGGTGLAPRLQRLEQEFPWWREPRRLGRARSPLSIRFSG